MNKDLTVGSPSKVLWQFCLPMFGSILFQQLYNIADSLVAGKLIGENALAAAVKGLPRGRNGQRGGRFVLGAPVPGADAGAAGDPCVTGIHHAAQLVIGDRPSGKCPAGGDQL